MADETEESDGGGQRRTYLMAAIGIAAVLVAAGFFVTQGQTGLPGQLIGPSPGDSQQQQDEFDQYASANQDAATTETQGATVGATVQINQNAVSPVRAEVATGEAVKWMNTNDFPVEITFAQSDITVTIEAGGSDSARLRRITDYTVRNADTGNRVGVGEVVVG